VLESIGGASPVQELLAMLNTSSTHAFRTITALIGLSILAVSGPAQADDSREQSYTTIEYANVIDSRSNNGGSAIPVERRTTNARRAHRYGPFYIIDENTAGLDNVIDSMSPNRFRALMAAWPNVDTIRILECPGTVDDEANLVLARMIRSAGMRTVVPSNGSARSGGVELFLAGAEHRAEPGAELGVHSWVDENGREAKDYPRNDPVHQEYIRYYIDMGFSPDKAREFYAFTNTIAPHDGIHFMTRQELAHFNIAN